MSSLRLFVCWTLVQWNLVLGYSANSRGLTGGNQRLHLLPDDSFSSPKQRVISPNEIASLFGKSSFTPKSTRKDANIEENDLEEENDLDEDEYEEEEDDIRTSEGLNSASSTSSLGNSRSQSMPSAPSTFTSSKAYPRAEVIPDAPGLEYLDLTADLDEERRGKIAEALTLQDDSAGLLSTSSASPRVVRYDAQAEYSAIYDPMNYGAYSRWKKAEEAVAKEKSSKQGKKKTKEGLSPDSFYNAIKNLGSGPKSNDAPTGVGLADGPKGKSPITPKKGLAKKNKRKVITPDEIDSLFATKKQNDQTAEEEEEEDGNDIGMDQDKMRKVSNQNKANSGSNDVTPAASVPQWIMDAEKAAKKQRGGLKSSSKKQRKLTDDWRFWGALIAVAGFASAFASVYQQTGGFGSGTLGGGANELII